MIITVATVSTPFVRPVRALVSDPTHQVAVDTRLAGTQDGQVHTLSPGLSLFTPAQATAAAKGPDLERLYKVLHEGLWPMAKELPLNTPTIEGVEIVFAGKKVWDRITAEEGMNRLQVALAAGDFALEVYDLLVKFYPPLQVSEPYRMAAGLLINGADVTYATYFTRK